MVGFVLPADAADRIRLPTPDHVVVVVMENHSFGQIAGATGRTAYLRDLARRGASFANSFAVSHPSQPNYFALFSGSTHGVRDDRDHMFDAPTLGGALVAAHRSFVGYVESGSPRKHNPWESFADSQGMERIVAELPADFTDLPTVAFVIPDLDHDMHDGTVAEGDRWLRAHLGPYAAWAETHNSLLIVTFDEDDFSAKNGIMTIIVGDHVKPGVYQQRISHYTVLRTILEMYGLAPFGNAAAESPIAEIWSSEAGMKGQPPGSAHPSIEGRVESRRRRSSAPDYVKVLVRS
jgi:acid phosphatase